MFFNFLLINYLIQKSVLQRLIIIQFMVFGIKIKRSFNIFQIINSENSRLLSKIKVDKKIELSINQNNEIVSLNYIRLSWPDEGLI